MIYLKENKSVYLLAAIVVILLANVFLVSATSAQNPAVPIGGISTQQPSAASQAIAGCVSAAMAAAQPQICTVIGGNWSTGTGFTCTGDADAIQMAIAAMKAAINKCTAEAEKKNASLINDSSWAEFAKHWANIAIQEAKQAKYAGALKTSLSALAKNVAYETATWVASGGKGQKPLFITEGWDAYLGNAVDSALGNFLDLFMMNNWGVDICTPNISVKLGIIVGINWQQPQPARCKFSEIVNNWERAVANPNFTTDFRSTLRPGENDVSAYLMAQTSAIDKVNFELWKNSLKAMESSGFKPLTDLVGNILTPSRMVAENAYLSRQQANAGYEIFTNTAWDFVDTFVQTLVGKLLQNLMSGFFCDRTDESSSSGSGSSGKPDYSFIYDSESQPFTGSSQAAQSRYLSFTLGELKSGEAYDILNKLSVCTEATKANPGPTDCVIDDALASAIREKKLVMKLSDSILDRRFAPRVAQVTDPQTAFTLRNITILRKYRIVPVGWEIAAQYISQYSDKDYTLRQLMNAFSDPKSEFKGLVDPYWVMKAPELFCRRQGYGQDLSQSQDQGVDRTEYCADEQQCIAEDDNGNCTAFGYCTEEKRVWDFGGTKCEPRFNTCQTFTSSAGTENSYLANTLDYRNCNAQNAGCKWYSTAFNPVSDYWGSISPTKTLIPCDRVGGCVVPTQAGRYVSAWYNTSRDNTVILGEACRPSDGSGRCDYSDVSCTIPQGGIMCRVNQCFESSNLLTNLNGDFAQCSGWDANYWLEGYEVANKRHACALGQGRTNNALEAYSIGGNSAIVTTLPNIRDSVEANQRYALSFYARGTMVQGAVTVDVSGGGILGGLTINHTNFSNNWRQYQFEFTNAAATNFTIRITTIADTTNTVYFDDFDLRRVNENCARGSVWLTLGAQDQNSQDIFFNKNAQACEASAAGCSQFIRTKAGVGSNLVENSGFEIAANNLSGWQVEPTHSCNGQYEISTDTKHSGQNSVKLTTKADLNCVGNNPSDKVYVFTTEPAKEINFQAGKRYAVSAWAMANGGFWLDLDNHDTCLDPRVGCPGFEPAIGGDPKLGSKIVAAGVGRNAAAYYPAAGQADQWQRIYFVFDVRAQTGADFHAPVRLVSMSSSTQIYLDDVKVEEISYNQEAPTDYTAYTPSERPANQLAYLKYAPDYYHCYLTATKDWPLTKADLLAVLSGRSSQCADYASVCLPEEVGCDLYRPINKDPAVPGIANSGDLCPAECLGYENYLQKETNFTSPNSVQFIADQTPKYCSASYAGCDQFTNLDTVAKGGEGLEYYSQIRPCDRADESTDGGTYYTWEGSDNTGYQLKSFRLKVSQSGSLAATAPCTNLYYYQAGANKGKDYCGDPTGLADLGSTLGTLLSVAMPKVGVGDVNGYLNYLNTHSDITDKDVLNQDIVDELHKFGLCVKQELRGYFYFSGGADSYYISVAQNPDCREFYNVGGNISYRLLSRTVSVSDNCHPYRRTQTQTNQSVSCPALPTAGGLPPARAGGAQAGAPSVVSLAQCDCVTKHGYWNEGGQCVYMAVPGEGLSCPAEFAKCREYTGNQGYNWQNISLSDFEKGTDGWVGGTLSPMANAPGGSSLVTRAQIKKNIYLLNNKTYILSFWAKGGDTCTEASPCELNSVKFSRAANVSDYFAVAANKKGETAIPTIKLINEWRKYDLGPVFMNFAGDGGQDLEINANNQQIYVDNILLKEVQDNVFLVENSWFTPVKCDNKLSDPTGEKGTCPNKVGGEPYRCYPGEMVGCQTYFNQADEMYNLKSFSKLCRSEAVGCEALIDTHNSDSPLNSIYNPGDIAEVKNATDTPIYLVNNKAAACGADNKGCTAYGLPQVNNRDEVTGYDEVYLKNLPDQYSTQLCQFNELWCEAFTGSRSAVYFKDPRSKVCDNQYTTGTSTQPTINSWLKRGSNEPCAVTPYQTMGQGTEAAKLQPVGWFDNATGQADPNYNGWAGACPANQNSCTEYIDPLAKMYTNLIYNGDFEQDVDKNEVPDGWLADGQYVTENTASQGKNTYAKRTEQTLKLQSHTLYTVSALFGQGINTITVECSGAAKVWSPDASATSTARNSIELKRNVATADANVSARFYFEDDNSGACTLKVTAVRADNIKVVKTGVYYNLDNTINRTACNGLVDFKTGCVLFNDRGQINYNEANNNVRVRDNYLTFDADKTEASQPQPKQPAIPDSAAREQKNADSVIKVTPDRQCASWLYCNTYEKGSNDSSVFGVNDRCLDLSLCSSVNASGECDNLVVSGSQTEQKYSESQLNKTGYSVVGADILTAPGVKKITGYYPFDTMAQTGKSVEVPNGNFDSVLSGTTEPIGWYDTGNVDGLGWKDYKFLVESVKQNRKEGAGYLRLNAAYQAESEVIDVEWDKEYIFDAWVNTKNLYPTSSAARITIFQLTGSGWDDGLNIDVPASSPWTEIKRSFTPDGKRLKIVLSNWLDTNNDTFCDDGNNDGLCDVTGYSFFDNISLKANLKINNNTLLGRDCRTYPARDALSCKYFKDQNLFYGWYGFCLTKDPQNPNQCLQWWPIEQLQGETLDEIGYSERVPLYYCINPTRDDSSSKATPVIVQASGEFKAGPNAIHPKVVIPGREKQEYGEYKIDNVTCTTTIKLNTGTQYDRVIRLDWKNNFEAAIIDTDGTYVIPPSDALNAMGSKDACNYVQTSRGYNKEDRLLYTKADVDADGFLTGFTVAGCNASGTGDTYKMTCTAHLVAEWCGEVAKVVTVTGMNKNWYTRLQKGNQYKVDGCYYYNGFVDMIGKSKITGCTYATDYQPFGSILPPEPVTDPRFWDAREDPGVQPLFWEEPAKTISKMGNIHTVNGTINSLKELFVRYYGLWDWAPSSGTCDDLSPTTPGTCSPDSIKPGQACTTPQECVKDAGYRDVFTSHVYADWDIPAVECSLKAGGLALNRPADKRVLNDKYCYIRPRVLNIKINNSSDPIVINSMATVRLAFNVFVDPDQLPLTDYTVDWGDGNQSVVSGANLRSRNNLNDPFSLYHYYDYWQTKAANNATNDPHSLIYCAGDTGSQPPGFDPDADKNSCWLRVQITVKDNWGWENIAANSHSDYVKIRNK